MGANIHATNITNVVSIQNTPYITSKAKAIKHEIGNMTNGSNSR
jgi:hypothetical protein